MSKPEYILETGLNRKQQPVLVCSPELYDQLIAEARLLIDGADFMGVMSGFIETYPVIGLLATQPKYSEIQKSN